MSCLFSVLLLAGAVLDPAIAVWIEVTESESGAVTYIDPASVVTDGDVTYARELWDFDAVPDETESKSVRRMGNRCATRERASFEDITYDAQGKVIERYRFDGPDWSVVERDSVGDALFIAACTIAAERLKATI